MNVAGKIDLSLLEEEFDENADTLFANRPTSRQTSAPRTKNRPTHETTPAIVLNTERGRYFVKDISNNADEVKTIFCSRARELRNDDIVPGDIVNIKMSKNLAHNNESAISITGRIVSINERNTVLQRTTDDTKTQTKVIAANADQCLIICSTISPNPQFDFLRRCYISAVEGGLKPIFYLTKTDLEPAFDELKLKNTIATNDEIKIVRDFEELHEKLDGKATVFVGLSGVGKSTLINKLIPDANRKVGDVSINGDGRHTSTSSFAFYLNSNSLIIDTPGIRSFGLGHII